MNPLRIDFYSCSVAIFASFMLLLAYPANSQAQIVKEATKLDLTIRAAADVNPNDQGQAAPILVRIYELKSDDAFNQADFFSLQNSDKALLGADLLVRDEFILRPGDSKTLRRKSYADTTVIGVLAAYRDLPNASWRALYKLPEAPEAAWYRSVLPLSKVKLDIELRTKDIHITEIK